MHFFPPLFPDEILYSVFARFHDYSGNENYKKTMRDLFGSMTVCSVTDFPCHLAELSQRIPGKVIHKETFLYQHTLFPYYSHFGLNNRLDDVIYEMMYRDGSAIHMKMGMTANNVKNVSRLKYCLSCSKNDRSQYGIAYWHRTHQLPGVIVCHKHQTRLIESVIPFASRRNKHEFIQLEAILKSDKIQEVICDTPYLYYIAQCSYQLLSTKSNFSINLNQLNCRYKEKLKSLDMLTATGRIKFKELIPRFIEYYGYDFLMQIGSTIDSDKQDTWFHKILRNAGDINHPIRHIIIHIFLNIDITSTIQYKYTEFEYKPFGSGPWVCLNKAATHFGEEVITICNITRCSNTGKPVGTFTCSCGFIYSRRGPDHCNEDRMKIGRIKDFGKVWKDKLQELLGMNNLSLREKARRLGVDPMTIKRQSTLLLADESTNTNSAKHQEILRKIVEYRINWLFVKDDKSSPIRRKIYFWLYKNDRDWLSDYSPIRKSVTILIRVNWEQRDEEIAAKVSEVANSLKMNRTIRISKNEIGRQIGCLSLLTKKLDKMPMTKCELDKVVETTEQFQLRRIDLCIQEMKQTHHIIKPWRVAKMAGLSTNSYNQLKEFIINQINNNY
jgi:hypothetical protein